MAFGLSPKHVEDFSVPYLNQKHAYLIAVEAAKSLGWNIGLLSGQGLIAYTNFSMSSWSEEVQIIIEAGNINLKSLCTGSQLADWGKNKENIQHFIAAFNKIQQNFTAEDAEERYAALAQDFVSPEEDIPSKTPLSGKDKIGNFLVIFKPTDGFYITPILLNINLAIFIMMAITGVNIMLPDNESLLLWGANFRPMTLEREWWRLLSSCFIHIGILHLLLNMYALVYIGLILEPYLGKSRFLAAYLLTGIAASVTSLYWNDLTISAGASGAIFGMYGVFLAMLTTNIIEKSARRAMLTSIVVFVGYNLMNGMKEGIDNAAHIGGLVSGLVVGYAYYYSLIRPELNKLKPLSITLLTVLILSVSAVVIANTTNDVGIYEKEMQKFISMEEMALEVYNLPKNTPTETLLAELQDRGIYYWKENIKLLNSIDKLELPDKIRARNQKLLEYCNLRIQSYLAIHKAITEDTDKYQSEIEEYNRRIEAIINELTIE